MVEAGTTSLSMCLALSNRINSLSIALLLISLLGSRSERPCTSPWIEIAASTYSGTHCFCNFRKCNKISAQVKYGHSSNKNSVCAECLFIDPIADIAVLGCPDGQELYDEAEGARASAIPPRPIDANSRRMGY